MKNQIFQSFSIRNITEIMASNHQKTPPASAKHRTDAISFNFREKTNCFFKNFNPRLCARKNLEGSAKWTGLIQGLAGRAGVPAGVVAGYLSDRYEPGKMAIWLCRKTSGANERNIAFAWAASIRSAGWFLAPLAANLVFEATRQIRMIFLAASLVLRVTALLIQFIRKPGGKSARDRFAVLPSNRL